MEIVGQSAGERPNKVIPPILPESDVQNFDLQNVARLGTLDGDGAGQDMSGQHPFVFRVNLRELGRDVKSAAVGYHIRSAADGVDRHLVAAGNPKDGLQPGFEEAPVTGLGAGMQVMMCHDGLLFGAALA